MTPAYTYINADDLAQIIKDAPADASSPAIQVVDVRDDDFRGGNIVGARNVPTESFAHDENREALRSLAEEMRDVPKVVFHCALSQVRGPKAARIYSEIRKEVVGEEKPQEVLVLRHGFTGFQQRFRVSFAVRGELVGPVWTWYLTQSIESDTGCKSGSCEADVANVCVKGAASMCWANATPKMRLTGRP